MSINLPPAVFQILLLIGCGHVFRITDCLELNATHGVAFSTNEVAEFYCEIDPYTKSQTWFVNSISVSDCGFIVCAENASNPGRYHFSSNTTIGTFIFKIDPTTSEDNGNVIRCSDGTNYTDIQIAVTVREDVGDDGGGKCSWWCFLIIVVLIVVIAVIVVIILCIMCPRFIESIVTETTIYLRWTKMKCPCCQDSSTDSIVCKTENGEPQKKVLKEKHCTFEKLDPMKEYVINLSSGNECFCIWKKNITTTITTLPAKPNVKIIVGITEIYLDWTNPANPKGAVNQELSYLIICQNKEITTSLDTKYKIVKLSPGKTYTIEVYAIKNKIESSPWTKDLTTLKGISLSLKPSAVLCDINWTAPTVEGSDEFTYMLKYCLVDNGTWITEGKDIRERKFTLNHLELNSVYKIRVYAIYQSKVLDPPGEEEFKTTLTPTIGVSNPYATHCVLGWTVPTFQGSDELSYKLDYCLEKEDSWTTIEHLKQTNFTLGNLEPNTAYKIQVYARYNTEILKPPGEVRFETKLIPTFETPKPSALHCDIHWNVPTFKGSNKLLYKLEYCLANKNNWITKENRLQQSQFKLDHLEPNTAYKIRVYAIYKSKMLEPPGEVRFETRLIPHITPPTSSEDQCEIHWTVPTFQLSDKLQYKLELCLENEDRGTIIEHNLRKTSFKLDQLEPKTAYKIRVYVIYKSKMLMPPGEVRFETQDVTPTFEPPKPSTLHCDLHWKVPTFQGSNKLLYKLEYCLENEDNWTICENKLQQTEFTLDNLEPLTAYKIRVFAIYKSKILGPPGEVRFETLLTPTFAPPRPTSTDCDIRWTVPNFKGSNELSYKLEYCLENEGGWTKIGNILHKTQFLLQHLEPERAYKIQVHAIYKSKILQPPGEVRFVTHSYDKLPTIGK